MLVNLSFFKLYKPPLLLALTSVVLYFVFAYNLVRTDYIKLLTLYTALFYLFYKMVQTFKHHTQALGYLAFAFRAVFIWAIPNLSQDFYRFIWDGRMLLEGYNPYLHTPESLIRNHLAPIAQANELYRGMGTLNAGHFTNYPPINQLCFAIAALFSGKSILGSVIVMRLLIIAADLGSLHFGKKLLKELNMPSYYIFWYILNPFIIIELTGNLHFEGIMIFFLVWSLYLLHKGKWQWAALALAFSISTKLIPLMLLPLFFQWFVCPIQNELNPSSFSIKNAGLFSFKLTRLFSFYGITGIATIISFAPFYSFDFLHNYTQTVALWFKNFEFNASFYYLAREIGYALSGYNQIAVIGKGIMLLVVLFVLFLTFFKNNRTIATLISSMLLSLSFYYFTATTVHPWYVATLLILSVFTNYKFPLVWSFVIILSYLSYVNINSADKSENLWIISLEYILVYAMFIWEVFVKKKPKQALLK